MNIEKAKTINEATAIKEINKLVRNELINLNLKLDEKSIGQKRAYEKIAKILNELKLAKYIKNLHEEEP